jgi:23S rRNA pseudouridine2605 synthase
MKKSNDRPPRKSETKRPSDKRSLSNDRPKNDRPKPSTRPKTDHSKSEDKKPFTPNPRVKRDFSATDPKRSEKRDFSDRPKRDFGSEERPKRDFSDRPKREFGSEERPKRDFSDRPKREFGSEDRPKRDFSDRPKREFGSEDRPKREFGSEDRPKRDFSDRPKREFGSEERPKRDFSDRPKREFGSEERPKRDFSDRPKREFGSEERPKRDFSDRPKREFGSEERPKRDFSDRKKREFEGEERPKRDFSDRPKREFEGEARPKRTIENDTRPTRSVKPASDRPKRETKAESSAPKRESRPRIGKSKNTKGKSDAGFSLTEKPVYRPHIDEVKKSNEDIRLNKFLADSGIAARRKASEMVLAGEVTVNGAICREPGYRVQPKDDVKHNGKSVKPVEKMIYLLMNKPKDTITTVSDERGRHTVMELVSRTVKTRIFPVGRLDRDTTGLLMLTNDGDLAQKMTHPSYRLKKLYQVELHKAVTKHDMEAIAAGLELEDGVAEVDAVNYLEGGAKSEVMIELHIGKNRIVRRIFEHLGYQVVKLDRIYYGGLTKKDLPRGGYRSLTEREIIMLKHFSGK